MVKHWHTIRLGDACVTNASSYSPKEVWTFVNYLDTGNITENRIDSIQHIDLAKEELPSRAKRKVKKNSIIYSTVRPNQRHYGIIKTIPQNFLVSTGFAVIDADSQLLDADFLYYVLTQATVVDKLHAIAAQSTSAYPSLRPSDIENLEIDIPTLDEQRAIASILRCIDEKIRLNTQKLDFANKTGEASIFKQNQLDIATAEYGELEKKRKKEEDTVLVSSASLSELKKAYPNYFIDASEFIKQLKRIFKSYGLPVIESEALEKENN